MAREITEMAKSDFKSFIEIEREGATVVQFREYRISIARPPFLRWSGNNCCKTHYKGING